MDIFDDVYHEEQEDAGDDWRGVLNANERLVLMSEYQHIIRSYGWQSAAARLLAIGLAPAFLALGGYHLPLWPVAAVLCLVLLWLLDGYWREMRLRYIMVFHDVVHSGRKPDLEIQTYETFNVDSLWHPVQAVTYFPLIGLFAFLGLR